jgi:hypothetical protein
MDTLEQPVQNSRQQAFNVFEMAIEEIYARIGVRVREDSEKRGCLTPMIILDSLTPEPELIKIEVNLVEMVADKRYQDICFATTPAGNTYLYSSTYISKENADILAANEDVTAVIAEKIRDNSRRGGTLTDTGSLIRADDGNRPAQVAELRALIEEMSGDERYQDIKSIPVPSKGDYYYSGKYVTKRYAEILARAEANDPCAQIATTVREDSKIYPRPTSVLYLTDPVFGLDPIKLDGYIDKLLANKPEYADIKIVLASNGAGYLYSDLFLEEALAKAQAEWNEVGRWDNP